ncbi:hypothetical protein [Halalkalicoccus tibetensis]|uniref:DUF8009 domain-containing protein n=1 Tax=Halalkalicoccus tibetensis TaxID=175632 RepID=A0ABD5V4Z3_9EURY
MASDPRTIRSIAVTAEDAVSAYEASERSATRPVLRITPPFNGRMRARLHLPGDANEGSEAIHLRPADLFDPERLPPYPEPADTESEIRDDPDLDYSTELHHDRHVERVEEWRERARGAFVETVELDTSEGPHRIEVKVLGR